MILLLFRLSDNRLDARRCTYLFLLAYFWILINILEICSQWWLMCLPAVWFFFWPCFYDSLIDTGAVFILEMMVSHYWCRTSLTALTNVPWIVSFSSEASRTRQFLVVSVVSTIPSNPFGCFIPQSHSHKELLLCRILEEGPFAELSVLTEDSIYLSSTGSYKLKLPWSHQTSTLSSQLRDLPDSSCSFFLYHSLETLSRKWVEATIILPYLLTYLLFISYQSLSFIVWGPVSWTHVYVFCLSELFMTISGERVNHDTVTLPWL